LFGKSRRASERAVGAERRRELLLFQRHAAIRFRELERLEQAFTHRSWANESGSSLGNNERLEFLGDSVLGLVVAEYLHEELPDQPEGELARIKSFVVSEASLSEISRRLRVDNYILIGRGEEYSGGRSKKAILADALEAIIGAYYLDSGFPAAKRFVEQLLVPEIDKVREDRHEKDYKTLLQEHVQKRMKTYPHYHVVQKTGPDHDRTFLIEVRINNRSFGQGRGKNKKEAEQDAARAAWTTIQKENERGQGQRHERPSAQRPERGSRSQGKPSGT
jgi:ribonuclease III